MGLFQLIKRSLGFGDDSYEAENNSRKALPNAEMQQNTDAEVTASNRPAEPDAFEFDSHMKELLFDNVLKVFDEALPDFLRRSMDAAAQRAALYEALDSSVANYLAELEKRSSALAEAHAQAATDQMKAENDRLTAEIGQMQQQKEKIREQQLSAERRLRAQQDRTKSLEEQVAKLEAESEQYQLENSSLVNKVKLAQVQPEVIADLQKEIEHLRAGDVGAAEEARKAAEEAKKAAEAQLAEAQAELKTVRQQSDDMKQGVEMTNKMYADTVESLTDERARHETTKKELEAAGKELEALRKELEQTRQKIIDQQEITDTVEKLSGEMTLIEEKINERDQKIAELKEINRKLKEELAELREHQQNTAGQETAPIPTQGEELVEEDDFECPEWFVSEPTNDNAGLRREPNLDFGYSEPPKKQKAPDSDAQLPLF